MKPLGTPIEYLHLTERLYHALLRAGLDTVEQVRKLKVPQSLKGIGERGEEEIQRALAAYYSSLPPLRS